MSSMERSPLLSRQNSVTFDATNPVSSVAVPLGATAASGLARLPPPSATKKSPIFSGGQQGQQQRQHQGHHERNNTEYTWLNSIFTRDDTKLSLDDRRRLVVKLLPPKFSVKAKLFLLTCYLAFMMYSIIIFVGPVVLAYRDEAQWCSVHQNKTDAEASNNSQTTATTAPATTHWVVRHYGVVEHVETEAMAYGNPDYDTNPCRYIRLLPLMGLTLEDCDMCRRMVVSVILGGAIGYERRSSDRPAGIRTMALVSLGSCVFTIGSILAFASSTMGWDASRVTAALPSGIGFLGGALIWKGTIRDTDGQDRHQVHGLTTAASLWLSAAVGVGAGGALYVVTTYATILVLLVLRYGPKIYDISAYSLLSDPSPEPSEQPTETQEGKNGLEMLQESNSKLPSSEANDNGDDEEEDHPLRHQSERSSSFRRRRTANLGPTFHS